MTQVFCQNCRWTGTEKDGRPIEKAVERVLPGEVMAYCECPRCGAVCHDGSAAAKAQGPALLDALKDAVREMRALMSYGERRFGDEWWPAKDKKYCAALKDLVLKKRYDDIIAHAEPKREGAPHDHAKDGISA